MTLSFKMFWWVECWLVVKKLWDPCWLLIRMFHYRDVFQPYSKEITMIFFKSSFPVFQTPKWTSLFSPSSPSHPSFISPQKSKLRNKIHSSSWSTIDLFILSDQLYRSASTQCTHAHMSPRTVYWINSFYNVLEARWFRKIPKNSKYSPNTLTHHSHSQWAAAGKQNHTETSHRQNNIKSSAFGSSLILKLN
jgi:hypothetical protein